jgi:hypothetical protein
MGGRPVEQVAQSLENAKHIIQDYYEAQDNSVLPSAIPAILSLCQIPCDSFTAYSAAVTTLETQDKSQLFALEIILLVLLHQSLELLDYYPHLSPLSRAQIPIYFSKRLLRLMRIVARCDSMSYDFKNIPMSAEHHRRAIDEKMDLYDQLLV